MIKDLLFSVFPILLYIPSLWQKRGNIWIIVSLCVVDTYHVHHGKPIVV